ncbi:putative ribonuclease H-like domain-containing protein [Tanacetum coccineum]
MPLWKDGSLLFDSSPKISNDAGSPPSGDTGKKHDEVSDKESEISNELNSAFENLNTEYPYDPKMPGLETIETYDDYEEEADFTNLESSIHVSPTPTTGIHKNHPLKQVIRSLNTPVQTRSKIKPINEQGFISVVYEGKTHEDLNTCLFTCFLSQIEPTRVAKALSDLAWVDAMQEELLQNKKDERGIVIKNKARIEAIRLFLAYASFMGFMVYQMDIKSAFLYGRIEDEVYVCQPLGFEDPDHPDKVYVDDIIFGSTKKDLCIEFKKLMKDKFQMSSMGELTFFLVLQVKQKEDGIFISQDKYVAEVLRKFNFSNVKSTSTLVDTEKTLVKVADGDDVDVHLYRSMIGSLMYLTASRPDIIYLKGQSKLGLWYPIDTLFELVAYTDSDYAGASLDRKSTTGGCQFLGSILINGSARSKLWLLLLQLKLNMWLLLVAVDKYSGFKIKCWIMEFCNKHNMVAYLKKPIGSKGFQEMVDFLNGSHIRYALTKNPTIYVSLIKKFWQTATVRTVDNGEQEITAIVDGKEFTLTEAFVRRHI